MEDDWPSGVALRGETSNRPMLRWLKTVVVNDWGKGAHDASGRDREDIPEGRSGVTDQPALVKRRNNRTTSKPGTGWSPGSKPGGSPLIGQVVSGAETM